MLWRDLKDNSIRDEKVRHISNHVVRSNRVGSAPHDKRKRQRGWCALLLLEDITSLHWFRKSFFVPSNVAMTFCRRILLLLSSNKGE